MIVLDASAALEFLLHSGRGQRVAAIIRQPDLTLHAPCLLDLEVTHALRRYARSKAITSGFAQRIIADLVSLRIKRYMHHELLAPVWSLRHNLTVYDAAYVALAEALGCELLTLDRRLANAPDLPVRCLVPE